MNRKQRIIVSITGIFIVMLALVGLTYAYFLTRITGNENDKSISVTTANLELVYGDGNNLVTASNIEPGDLITIKTFTVTNNGNATVNDYKVYLENVQNQLERKDDLVYTLTCKSYIKYGEEDQEVSGTCNGVNIETTFPSVITNIISNDIEVGITHEYELKAKYKEMNVDQSIDMNKLISAKINIADSKTKYLAREIMDNALSTETVDYNKTTYINPIEQDGTNYTIPAYTASLENERILTYTFDDLGTSYYYRGNVEDNYVNFAGMCWRIVRVGGDGSIKLILEDYNQECNTKDTDGNLNMDGNWNIPVSSSGVLTVNFGFTENSNTFQSFINYLNLDNKAKDYNKSLATAFYNFQNEKLLGNLKKLKSGDWCLSDNAYLNTIEDISKQKVLTKEEQNNLKDNFVDFYYDFYVRFKKKQITLKCNGTKMDIWPDNSNMFVGAIIADEAIYAGVNETNPNKSTHYLVNTYQNYYYWPVFSLSQFSYSDTVYCIDNNGNISGNYLAENPDLSVRPSIILKSDNIITSGNGTKSKPYVIS